MKKPSEANNFVPAGIIMLGLTPVIMVLLPWDFGSDMTSYRGFMRGNSLPVTIMECLFLTLAMARGFSPAAAMTSLPQLTKAGLILFLVAAIWTTIFVAKSSIIALLGMIKFFAHVMFGLAVVHQLKGWSIQQRRYIWPAIGWGGVGYCALWGVNIAFYNPVGEDWIWLVPTLTNIRWIGFFALATFCAGIGLLPPNSDHGIGRKHVFVALIFGTVGLSIAFWTGSRGAIVAILAAAIMSSLVLPVWRKLALFTLSSAALALAVTASLPVVHPSYGIDRIIGDSTPSNGGADVSSGRVQIWLNTVDKIAQRPVAGWGVDQFRFSFSKGLPGYRHPHQGILQLLFSNGLLGLLATLMIAIPFISQISRKFSHSYQFAAVAYLFGALSYGLYDGFFYYTYPVMIMLVAAACIVAPKSPLPSTDRSD
jgi:O-Antigen ligase